MSSDGENGRFVAGAARPLHPVAEALVQSGSGRDNADEFSVELARSRVAGLASLADPGPASVTATDITMSTISGAVRCRIYHPLDPEPGSILFLHGGGWVTGDLALSDPACRALAQSSRRPVLSVDYSLAPEHPFPRALDDGEHALRWLVEELRATPVVIAGESAGANLATVIARRSREAGSEQPVMQVLAYPITDASTESESHVRYGSGGSPLTSSAMRWYLAQYVRPDNDPNHPDVSPARAGNLERLPPTHLVVAEHDPLRDDGVRYAELLRAAGVPVTLDYHADMFHGFWTYYGVLPPAASSLTTAGQLVDTWLSQLLEETPHVSTDPS